MIRNKHPPGHIFRFFSLSVNLLHTLVVVEFGKMASRQLLPQTFDLQEQPRLDSECTKKRFENQVSSNATDG